MARMSPGREMKKYMDDPHKVGADPEMQMKKLSSKRNIMPSSKMGSQEKRIMKMARMMKGK